jgi:hypothetical protein
LKPKTITNISLVVAVIGIFIAAIGMGMNDREGQPGSGTVVIWMGIAVIFVFGIGGVLFALSQTRKSKDE